MTMTSLVAYGWFLMPINRISALAVLLCGLLLPFPALAEKTASVLVVGSEIDFPPYAIVDTNGRASGFSVELLEAVTDAMGLPIKVNAGPWPEVLAAFKANKYDILPLVALSAKRADMATYTNPHTVAYDCFFVRRGSKAISSLADAKGKEVVVMSNDAAHEELLASGVQVRIVESKTIPEALRLLASGKHDAVLVPKLLGLQVLHEARLEGVLEAGRPIADYNRLFAFAVQRGNTDLRDKLEQGLAIVHSTGRYDELYKKWFGGVYPLIHLMKTVIVDNYQPYSFLNNKGEADGFSVEIARAVAKAIDLEIEFRADRWDESMKELEAGRIDLIPMMAYSPERDLLFDFSVPYTVAYDAIFFKKGITGIRSLKDLAGKKVIVTNNDAAHGYLLSSGLAKTMTIIFANSLPDALKQLSAGKADAAIMPKLVGLITLKKLKLSGIETSPQLIDNYTRPWSFAVKNGNQALLERLNQGLNIIKSTGEYDVIYKKWFGALEGPNLQWKAVIKYGSAVALILLGSIVWNVMMKREVKAKTEHLLIEIADHKRAEEEKDELAQRFKLAVSSARLGVWDWNVRENTMEWDDRMFELYGITQKTTSNNIEIWMNGLHPEDKETAIAECQAALKGEKEFDIVFRVLHPDGTVKHHKASALVIRGADGTAERMIGINSDITAHKQYEKELQDINAELERFTYTVSHDLKSPIITIKGFTGSLEKDLENGNYQRMAGDLKRVSAAADKMNDLLRDLLELSTIGRIINTPEPVAMNLLVEDVLAQLAGPLKNRNITVTVQPGLPTLLCDRRRMAEVVQNLLENAINYMGDQTEPRIQLGMREEAGENIFFVQDNGIGIDEKFHQIIFGLFNKLDAESEGTGIGLALVKRIIEVHGGRVWVESEGEGTGSRFCFTVPE